MGADNTCMATHVRAARTRAGAFGLVASLVTVIAVVVCEFLLLYAVYHRADSLHSQRAVVARRCFDFKVRRL